jgi:hypothetical protein
MGTLTSAPPVLLARQELAGAMPAVNAVLARLGFGAIVRAWLPPPDPRCRLDAAAVTGVLVRNLACGRQPLYGLAEWAAGYQPAQLGLAPGQAALLNDDRAGRVLDALFEADRASMMTALAVATVRGFGVSTAELHNDSTSIALYGAYQPRRGAGADDGGAAAGRRPPRPARGHSKDHRPDLKQLVAILTVTGGDAVPFTFRLADGNTDDAPTHIATWQACRQAAGHPGFLYVSDSKLAAAGTMTWIDGQGGRFVTVLPRSRAEDKAGRAAIAAGQLPFPPAAVRPGRRGAPRLTWQTAPGPAPSAEGFPITWVRSSGKRDHDARARGKRITRAVTALQQLAARLENPRCRLKTEQAITRAADDAISSAYAGRWVSCTLTRHDTVTRRQIGRGRPSPFTRYRDVTRTSWTITPVTDDAQIARDQASDGCYPLITNDPALTPAQVLAAHKNQPRIERRHSTFKTVLRAAPVWLKTPERIDALAFCLYTALLTHALLERQLRTATAAAGIPALPLYPEHRPAPAPSGAAIIAALAPITTTILTTTDSTTRIPPQLTPLQQQLTTLLNIPPASYHQQPA